MKKGVRGVGLFILDDEGKFYAIRELVSKKGAVSKNIGDISIPLETLEEEEGHDEAVVRLFKEEVDATGVLQITDPVFIGEYALDEDMLHTTVFLYMSAVRSWNRQPFAGTHAGTEYEPYGFVTEAELLNKGRYGTGDLLTTWRLYSDLDIAWSGG